MICQWVNNITDFSSQYGNDLSLSYIVGNLIGPPKVYPKYGDYADTSVLRTYGPWWDMCPSKKLNFSKDFNANSAQDFIEFEILNEVYATSVDVYETYNPGAIVALYSAHVTNDAFLQWKCLYEKDKIISSKYTLKSRIHSMKFNTTTFPVKLFRLILDSSNLDYYTELDAISVTGHLCQISDKQNDEVVKFNQESICIESEGSSVDPSSDCNLKKILDSDKINKNIEQNIPYFLNIITNDIHDIELTNHDIQEFSNSASSNFKLKEHINVDINYLHSDQKSDFHSDLLDHDLTFNNLNTDIIKSKNLNSINTFDVITDQALNMGDDVSDVTNIAQLRTDYIIFDYNINSQNCRSTLNMPVKNKIYDSHDTMNHHNIISSDSDSSNIYDTHDFNTNNQCYNINQSHKINKDNFYNNHINQFNHHQMNLFDNQYDSNSVSIENATSYYSITNNGYTAKYDSSSSGHYLHLSNPNKNQQPISGSIVDDKIKDNIFNFNFYTPDKIQKTSSTTNKNCNCSISNVCTNCEYIESGKMHSSQNICNLSDAHSSHLTFDINKQHKVAKKKKVPTATLR